MHNQLNLVAKEKHELTEEAQRLIKTIRQMERSLDDSRPSASSDYESDLDGLKVTFPLLDCIQTLKEKHHTVSRLHRERYEQVKKLVEALESYAAHLEPSFVQIKLPPTDPSAKIPPTFDLSPTYVSKLDNEFTRVYEEYNKRISTVSQVADEIINLWSELGTPQAQVDSNIVQFAHEAPEQLGLHQEDLKRLIGRRDKLLAEKQQRERRLKELKTNVESLWDRLCVDDAERKQFLAANRGCGLRQINEFEDELSRLNELKRQNLHLFVEDARFKLQELWDGLYFSEEEMLDFTPAFSHEYTDALLSAHEHEIARLEALKEQRAPILAIVDRHRSLIKDREDLEKSSQDATRLMAKGGKGEKRDPGKLLREEKMRKRITKELPKVEMELRRTLEAWEEEYGRPFLVHGNRYLDELEANQARAPPPRSKTPNALSRPASDAPKAGGRANMAQSRAGTMRGAPPRSKTPTGPPKMAAGRNPLSASVMSTSIMGGSVSVQSSGKMSPSKIPSATRLPMGTLRDGQNSPDRKLRGVNNHQALSHKPSRSEDLSRTVRSAAQVGPVSRPPPPKMKDLCGPPTPTTGQKENNGDFERSASVVRHIQPEDPYDDRYRTLHSSVMGPPPRPPYACATPSQESHSTTVSRPLSRQDYPVAPPSRQMSNTSSIASHNTVATSGSENWETYTDNSETEEADATEAYYAKVKAQQLRQQTQRDAAYAVKRPGTATAHLGASKRFRDEMIAEERDGSDEAWTDDLGDTY